MNYQDHYQAALQKPEAYWAEQMEAVAWFQKPSQVISDDLNNYGTRSWFPDGTLNMCHLALDQHLADGRGEQTAIFYDSPVTNTKEAISYNELHKRVNELAATIKEFGVKKGDRVLIYMPMIPQAVMAMLACARIGAVHVVVFGGFAPLELASRINDVEPSLIISASCGIEKSKIIDYQAIINEAISHSNYNEGDITQIIYQREQAPCSTEAAHIHDWKSCVIEGRSCDCEIMSSSDPLYILHTSGTTGKPKGIVHDCGGYAVALRYSMKNIYNVNPGDVYWAASDIGWVVGHSYIVYGPLLHGCSTILFEGKPVDTPDAGAFWRIISEYKVNAFFTAPTAFRAIRKQDRDGDFFKKYDCSSLRCIFLAGERADPSTLQWLKDLTGLPLNDHWWQTETGWAIVANMMGIEEKPSKFGSATVPVPGYDVQILDENCQELSANEQGNIAIKLPLPPGCLLGIWRNREYFEKSYLQEFPGYYSSGDGGYKDEDGYVFVMGRIDDVINIAGHRLSTGEMEEIISTHKDVAECAVVAQDHDLKGQVPIGFVVLQDGAANDIESLQKECALMLREKIGPIACLYNIYIVSELPKTRSGKILRKEIRSIANGNGYKVPPTILNLEALDIISKAISEKVSS